MGKFGRKFFFFLSFHFLEFYDTFFCYLMLSFRILFFLCKIKDKICPYKNLGIYTSIYQYPYVSMFTHKLTHTHTHTHTPIPDRVKPKTPKMVLDASLLNIQHYKI